MLYILKRYNWVRSAFRNGGFTLAEVLITLSIIGVVAAFIIPTLQASVLKKSIEVKLEKNYSALKNIELMSVERNGSMDGWSLIVPDGKTNFETYYEPYLKYNKKIACTYSGSDPCRDFATYKKVNSSETFYVAYTAYFLDDGSILYNLDTIGSAVTYLMIVIDTNGFQPPNQMGRDVFSFNMTNAQNKSKGILPYALGMGAPNECSTNNLGHECTMLLSKNGWRFPDNYPAY